MSKVTLPAATKQNPACGACGNETRYHVRGYQCEDCLLVFDEELEASFLNEDAEPCGAPCDNWWHGPEKIRPGLSFECRPCQLPAGHNRAVHWRGCKSTPAI